MENIHKSYHKFFNEKLNGCGVTNVSDLSDETKEMFFNELDEQWEIKCKVKSLIDGETILQTLRDSDMTIFTFAHYVFDEDSLGFGKIKEVYQSGGEGEGDHWESVLHFIDCNVYIRTVGSYTSYDGTEFYGGWNACSIVNPVEKVVTVFE